MGWEIDHDILVPDVHLDSVYRHGHRKRAALAVALARRLARLYSNRRRPDVCLIQYELLPYLPFSLEAAVYGRTPTVVDYDDATYTAYAGRLLLAGKIGEVMRHATHVIVGNQTLYEYAIQNSSSVRVIPTVVDVSKYIARTEYGFAGGSPVIGWIGTPITEAHLMTAGRALARLAKERHYVLRCVGASRKLVIPGVTVERVEWSEAGEAEVIRTFDVGIMPLPTNCEFAAGKCGLKLIQAMAAGVPVVGSAVGANKEIVQSGVNGFLARDDEEFGSRLEQLLSEEALRAALGANGRLTVEQRYSLDVAAPLLDDTLRRAATSAL